MLTEDAFRDLLAQKRHTRLSPDEAVDLLSHQRKMGGFWISPRGRCYPVEPYSHSKFRKYETAFRNGWVRFSLMDYRPARQSFETLLIEWAVGLVSLEALRTAGTLLRAAHHVELYELAPVPNLNRPWESPDRSSTYDHSAAARRLTEARVSEFSRPARRRRKAPMQPQAPQALVAA